MFHLKVSNDLEMYEIDGNETKERFEDLCNIRQPILFCDANLKFANLFDYIHSNYSAFDIRLLNSSLSETKEKYSIVALQDLASIPSFLSENNQAFVKDTGLYKTIQGIDFFLRPPMTANCDYDIWFGSKGQTTLYRFELNYRTFITSLNGKIKIKLTPPNYAKYLHVVYDYEYFEFYSPFHPFHIQDEYKADYLKTKSLEFELNVGQILYIPAYWFYSISFEENATLCCLKYKTFMNMIAIFPYYVLNYMQLQNTTIQNAPVVKELEIK
jgi:hypothetical protein